LSGTLVQILEMSGIVGVHWSPWLHCTNGVRYQGLQQFHMIDLWQTHC